MGLFEFLTVTVGVDPGSQNLRLVRGHEVIFNERSQVSIDRSVNKISGFGNAIRTTANDITLNPVNYVIADFQAFETLLRGALKQNSSSKSFLLKSYRIYCCVPTGITEVELRAYRDSAEHAGAKEVYFAHQASCAAIGMNLLFEKNHFILVDFGASKIEITIVANNLIVAEGLVRMGTWKIASLITNLIRRKHKIEISETEVENILMRMNTQSAEDEIKIQHVAIKIKELQEVLNNFFYLVNDMFLEAIERAGNHPDLEKILMNGIYFTGGGSAIDFLRNQIMPDSRIKRTLSQNPLLDNIEGLKSIMNDPVKYKNYLMT